MWRTAFPTELTNELVNDGLVTAQSERMKPAAGRSRRPFLGYGMWATRSRLVLPAQIAGRSNRKPPAPMLSRKHRSVSDKVNHDYHDFSIPRRSAGRGGAAHSDNCDD